MTSHLPDSWESLPALATVLDPGRLTELFGHELGGRLRTSRLRYKPEVSAVARVDVDGTGAVHWVAAYAPSVPGRDKLERILAGAGPGRPGHGAPVLVADVPDLPGHRLAVGRIRTDPGLRRPLAALGPERAERLGQPGDAARLLRYNPRRRTVLTGPAGPGPRLVTKITAGPSGADPVLLARLAAAGLPVLAPVPAPGLPVTPHVLHYPWFGDGDLAAHAAADPPGRGAGRPVLGAAAAAGAALAELHVRGPSLLGTARAGAPLDADRKLRSLAADLSALDPRPAARSARVGQAVAEAVAARPGSPARLLHGDFSADQVLVHGSAPPGAPSLRLADLDRMRTGAAADDLGAFLAVELLDAGAVEAPAGPEDSPLTGALLGGYGSVAALPPWPEILTWAAFHVLARSMEPFRSTTPDWRELTDQRLLLAERLAERARRTPQAVPILPGPAARTVPARTGTHPVRVPETVPGADGRPLRVRRAWPTGRSRLVLELEDEQGRVRAGTTGPGASGLTAVQVLPHGEDPRLPGLAVAVAAGGRVVVHRHGRRAVLAAPDRFVKVLAPGRAGQVAELSGRLHGLGTAAGLAVPEVLARTEHRVEFSVLPGRSLHELGAAGETDAYRAAWTQWAQRWPDLATAVPGAGLLPQHTAEDEAHMLARWADRLDAFPGLLRAPRGAVARLAHRIGEELTTAPAGRRARAVLHRDLHDKQLLFDGVRLGLLDFDTAALGEPELDLANLSVHLELRAAQGLLDAPLQAAGQEAVTVVAVRLGAEPARLAVHADATRLRLACLYAFRPRWRTMAQGLLDALLS
ncbi:phosphotransferase [Kocuria turfanensis]|uniref:Homoserine kinase type II (Protein kinase fold) n=1 Tax=Kocuria turfanensis TaxID=388357 RepID=A0A512IB78_9MICC|nr:phosphotransferase [Kocuria turfanensis]GEO94950.1 homoserine kinase type II (protein kinase fold) [Kocuria turfanensis]